MKKVLIVALLITAGGVWVQNAYTQSLRAVIRELRGTVETKAPGSSVWQAAALGQELKRETLLSTGFTSEAVLDLGSSILRVRPLTRVSLEEIAAVGDADRIEIYLRAGRIRAEVTPPTGGTVDFRIRSPIAVASVRGTSFEFDTVTLRVDEGTVSFSGADRTAVYASAGQSSTSDPVSGRTATPVETAAVRTPPPPAGVEAVAPSPPAVIPRPASQAPVSAKIRWDD
jgi:hypothetical protein